MSEKTLPEAGRAFVFRTPEGRKGASGTIWGKILCAEGQTGGKQVYPLSRREAKKLIPVQMVKRVLAILPILFLACALPAQELDPVTKWATVAALKYPVSFNVVYQKSNTVSLRLDVINAGPRTETRPTLIYMHGGGWVEGTKESTLLYALPYLAKGMNVVLNKQGERNQIADALNYRHVTSISSVLVGLSKQGLARTPFIPSGRSRILLLERSRLILDYAKALRGALREGIALREMKEGLREFTLDSFAFGRYVDACLEIHQQESPQVNARKICASRTRTARIYPKFPAEQRRRRSTNRCCEIARLDTWDGDQVP